MIDAWQLDFPKSSMVDVGISMIDVRSLMVAVVADSIYKIPQSIYAASLSTCEIPPVVKALLHMNGRMGHLIRLYAAKSHFEFYRMKQACKVMVDIKPRYARHAASRCPYGANNAKSDC